MNSTEKMEMQVDEAKDGGAIVNLPPDILTPDENLVVEGGSEALDDEGMGGNPQQSAQNDGLEDDPDREAIRAARREERRLKKQLYREKPRSQVT